MRLHTSIEAAMARAGIETGGARLYVEATSVLRAHGGDVMRSWRPFIKAVMQDEDLSRALALRYLRDVDADMDGLPGTVQSHGVREDRTTCAQSRQADRDGEGRDSRAPARPSSDALSAREPTQAQKAADSAIWKSVAKTVLDTFKVDGRPIGDLTMDEVRKIGRQRGTEHYLLAAINGHYANAPSNALVRELIKPSALAEMIKDAKVSADVF